MKNVVPRRPIASKTSAADSERNNPCCFTFLALPTNHRDPQAQRNQEKPETHRSAQTLQNSKLDCWIWWLLRQLSPLDVLRPCDHLRRSHYRSARTHHRCQQEETKNKNVLIQKARQINKLLKGKTYQIDLWDAAEIHVCKSRCVPYGAGKVRGHMKRASSGYNRVMLLQGNESTGNRLVRDRSSQRPDDEAQGSRNLKGKSNRNETASKEPNLF